MRMTLTILLLLAATAGPVAADPCGMVPPVWTGEGPPITRVGAQKTYVFFKNGVESFVIRPGFEGHVADFGMLIPFPTPPAIRKVADPIFGHVAAAVDPPVLKVWAFPEVEDPVDSDFKEALTDDADALAMRIRIVREEAVGMYQVAVLEAGSAAALKSWMDERGYRYPDGMDRPINDYVRAGWCFVAIKTQVGPRSGVDPRPGMRGTKGMPKGAAFDGYVQGMGFRFRTKELVVPMRLSAFNAGRLRNIVYLLTERPVKIRNLPGSFVVRQIPGRRLFENVTERLMMKVMDGTVEDLDRRTLASYEAQRDPEHHNGLARELFAGDLVAARDGRLVHPEEETEKELLRIGERFGLRGPELDGLHRAELTRLREQTIQSGLNDLPDMTMTVIDGEFPRDVIAAENLTFEPYTMPENRNHPAAYDAKKMGPGDSEYVPEPETRTIKKTTPTPPPGTWVRNIMLAVAAGLLLLVTLVVVGVIVIIKLSKR